MRDALGWAARSWVSILPTPARLPSVGKGMTAAPAGFFKIRFYLFLAVLAFTAAQAASGCGEWGLVSSCEAQARLCGGVSWGPRALGARAQQLRLPGSRTQAQ